MTMNDYIRERVAGAARVLWLEEPSHGMQLLLKTESGYSIVARQACRYMSAQGRLVSVRDYSALCTIRRRTADDAQWLWLNRCIGTSRLIVWDSETIRRAVATCKRLDESLAAMIVPKPRTYTLEDMRKAYAAGWSASGMGYNGEHGPCTDSENWLVERDEALRAL